MANLEFKNAYKKNLFFSRIMKMETYQPEEVILPDGTNKIVYINSTNANAIPISEFEGTIGEYSANDIGKCFITLLDKDNNNINQEEYKINIVNFQDCWKDEKLTPRRRIACILQANESVRDSIAKYCIHIITSGKENDSDDAQDVFYTTQLIKTFDEGHINKISSQSTYYLDIVGQELFDQSKNPTIYLTQNFGALLTFVELANFGWYAGYYGKGYNRMIGVEDISKNFKVKKSKQYLQLTTAMNGFNANDSSDGYWLENTSFKPYENYAANYSVYESYASGIQPISHQSFGQSGNIEYDSITNSLILVCRQWKTSKTAYSSFSSDATCNIYVKIPMTGTDQGGNTGTRYSDCTVPILQYFCFPKGTQAINLGEEVVQIFTIS